MKIPGILHRSEMADRGFPEAKRRRLQQQGQIRRLGPWYTTSKAPAELLPVLARGVRLTCVSAAERHGLWAPLHEGIHAYRPRGLSPVEPDGADAAPELFMHGTSLRRWPDIDPVADLPLALEHAARCLPVRDAAILYESAVHKKHLTLDQAHRLVEAMPRDLRVPLSRISASAESGTETAVRWWLEGRRVGVTPQVWIPDVGRVDLKVGRNWIIECDSRQFHYNEDQYHLDRARDLRLRVRGYIVTRLTWEQVFLDWASTEKQLLTVLRRREHRRRLAA